MADFTGGLDRDLQEKRLAKYDVGREQEVRAWVEAVLGHPLDGEFQESLKSGVELCNLLNKLKAGTIKNVNKGKMPFVQMENISNYLVACKDVFGMAEVDLFVTKDLYENYNMALVLDNLYSLSARSRTVGFEGPFIGAKQADKNVRDFSDEVLNKGKNVLSRQTQGSHGYQVSLDKNMDKIKRLDEAQSKASSGPTQQTQGSFGYQVGLDQNMDKIKRLDESQSKASSGPTRQTEGSFGYQVDLDQNMDKIKRLDESQSKASSGPTRQTEGSYGYQVDLDKNMDHIKRLDEAQSKASGGPTRQTQGSYGYQVEKERTTDAILRGNPDLPAPSQEPSRQTQGSYGYQDKREYIGVDQIVRNVKELEIDREKAKSRQDVG